MGFVRRSYLLLLIASAIVLSGCGRSMMATPLVYRDTGASIFGDLAPELQGDHIPILYVTDRKRASADSRGSRFYTSERFASGVLGIADVQIGRGADSWATTAGKKGAGDRSDGRISPSAIEVVSANELVRFPATPYLYDVGTHGRAAPDPEIAAELKQATTAARREIVRRLALTPKKEVFVSIHGVGNQYDDAIVSAAEFWHFLGREGGTHCVYLAGRRERADLLYRRS